jgi:hypothetical protein
MLPPPLMLPLPPPTAAQRRYVTEARGAKIKSPLLQWPTLLGHLVQGLCQLRLMHGSHDHCRQRGCCRHKSGGAWEMERISCCTPVNAAEAAWAMNSDSEAGAGAVDGPCPAEGASKQAAAPVAALEVDAAPVDRCHGCCSSARGGPPAARPGWGQVPPEPLPLGGIGQQAAAALAAARTPGLALTAAWSACCCCGRRVCAPGTADCSRRALAGSPGLGLLSAVALAAVACTRPWVAPGGSRSSAVVCAKKHAWLTEWGQHPLTEKRRA